VKLHRSVANNISSKRTAQICKMHINYGSAGTLVSHGFQRASTELIIAIYTNFIETIRETPKFRINFESLRAVSIISIHGLASN